MNHAHILRTAHAEARNLKDGSYSFLPYATIFALRLKEQYRLAKIDRAFKNLGSRNSPTTFEQVYPNRVGSSVRQGD